MLATVSECCLVSVLILLSTFSFSSFSSLDNSSRSVISASEIFFYLVILFQE